MLLILGGVGALLRLAWPYFAGLAVAAALAAWHWRLIRTRTREGCFKAFLHSNWVGAAVFAGIVASFPLDWLWP
jgi:4-hydroxybenzoate polyprenyltransferase